jgi:hypothetical protein
MDHQHQINEFNKLIGNKYQRTENEPYRISSFHFSQADGKIYVAIHPTSPNRRMLNITEEVNWFFQNYQAI